MKRGVARVLALLLRKIGFRKKVIEQNLQYAFPGDSDEKALKREELLREAYLHLGHLFPELLLLFGPLDRYVQKFGVLENFQIWEDARKSGKGVIFLASHLGNWEVMAGTGAKEGMDLLMVTKRLKPDWVHAAIEKGRMRCGVKATYEPQTFRDVLGHLRKNGTVGVVLDQYAGPPVGVRVPFFGVPVGTHSVIATLARRTGAPVLPVKSRREPDGRWVVTIEPPVRWETQEDLSEIALNTARYSERIEQQIRQTPGQWLWTHNRFKGELGPLRPTEWQEQRTRG